MILPSIQSREKNAPVEYVSHVAEVRIRQYSEILEHLIT
jgi:hypothetical protein